MNKSLDNDANELKDDNNSVQHIHGICDRHFFISFGCHIEITTKVNKEMTRHGGRGFGALVLWNHRRGRMIKDNGHDSYWDVWHEHSDDVFKVC